MNSEELLIIFTRNPELGKCKTRLAATIGDQAALDIYKFLLDHTVKITTPLSCDKQVHYSVAVRDNDRWDPKVFEKYQQSGEDLGARMSLAFDQGFQAGYQRIIIIGSDMYDLSQSDIEAAFEHLKTSDYVVGPALDGGYYLLGMNIRTPELFVGKDWGTDSVLKDTLADLKNRSNTLLDQRNDVDLYEDIQGIEAFTPFIKHLNL